MNEFISIECLTIGRAYYEMSENDMSLEAKKRLDSCARRNSRTTHNQQSSFFARQFHAIGLANVSAIE